MPESVLCYIKSWFLLSVVHRCWYNIQKLTFDVFNCTFPSVSTGGCGNTMMFYFLLYWLLALRWYMCIIKKQQIDKETAAATLQVAQVLAVEPSLLVGGSNTTDTSPGLNCCCFHFSTLAVNWTAPPCGSFSAWVGWVYEFVSELLSRHIRCFASKNSILQTGWCDSLSILCASMA